MVNAQQWLDQNYPLENTCIRENETSWLNNYGKIRNEITELSICDQNLTGELDLTTFASLEDLDCDNNQLTKLILPTNNRISRIVTSNNLLTAFEYAKLNPDTLTFLILSNNNLVTTDLNVFSPLVNLERLDLRNIQIKGSLKALKKMSKLTILDISDTELNDGVEYLTLSIQYLAYSTEPRPNCQLTEITTELEEFMQFHHVPTKQKIKEQEKLLRLFGLIQQKDISSEAIKKGLNIVIFNLEQEIIDDRKKLVGKENYQAQIEIPLK